MAAVQPRGVHDHGNRGNAWETCRRRGSWCNYFYLENFENMFELLACILLFLFKAILWPAGKQ